MANTQKQETIKSYLDLIGSNQSFILVKFEKVTHGNLEQLRRDLKKSQARLKIVKNSLLEKAVNRLATAKNIFFRLKHDFFPLKNNTALVSFGSDWSGGLKAFYDFIQKEKNLGFKCAIIDNLAYNEESTTRLARLPNRYELIAKIIGSLNSPSSRLVATLKFNTNKLVYILKQKSKGVT